MSAELPAGAERDYPMERLTTVRAGGVADLFVRVGELEALIAVLAYARDEDLRVGVVGSGSNLLVSDAGFRGFALKLEGDLATIERDGDRVLCGGGARLPAAAAASARWGLSGLEFGVNIPGSVGGAVRMNANAYGGELARTLEWVEICTADGAERRDPGSLGFRYRNSDLAEGEVVARASFALAAGEPEQIKATLAGMRSKRKEAQPSGIKTFGSTFKNPEDPRAEGRSAGQLLDAAGCRGLEVGGARFSPKHANFVENTGDGDDRRHPRPDGGGPPPRLRALRGRARARGAAARRCRVAGRLGARLMGALPKSLPRPRLPEGWPRMPRFSRLSRSRRGSRRSLPPWRVVRRWLIVAAICLLALAAAYAFWFRGSSYVAVEQVKITGAELAPDADAALRAAADGQSTLHPDADALRAAVAGDPLVAGIKVDTDFPHTMLIDVQVRTPVAFLDRRAS